eukprot:TRINITY_DN3097_c0_g2_i5.p1 TRINITY_DN3097_c0_g2~~TRINITY_DN3097_c0_g2_i5.p1  ORF type:complete len:276 (-),score=84.29 TRINITY_DN3097_c0_g2_i5:155-982(-)
MVKEIYGSEDREQSLCPSFMKSGSISLSLSQNELAIKDSRIYAVEQRKQNSREDSKKEEEVVQVEGGQEVVELPVQEEDHSRKEDSELTSAKEKRNRKFTREEDDKLKALVKIYGEGAWSRIADEMGGRNRKQVRERYVNFLKKERVVSEFTPEEDALILQFVQVNGRKWSSIAEQLTDKTPIMIKNRYYAKLRKTTKLESKQRSGSSAGSRADSSTGGQLTPSHKPAKQNGLVTIKLGKAESLEKLKAQEGSMKLALAELKKKIAKVKAGGRKV